MLRPHSRGWLHPVLRPADVPIPERPGRVPDSRAGEEGGVHELGLQGRGEGSHVGLPDRAARSGRGVRGAVPEGRGSRGDRPRGPVPGRGAEGAGEAKGFAAVAVDPIGSGRA